MAKKGKHRTGRIITQILIAMPVLTILFSLAAAKMIMSGTIGESEITHCAYVIAGLVAFLLSLYCAIRMPQKKALWGIATSTAYAIALLLGNLLFFGVGYGEILPTFATVIIAGSVGSVLGGLKRRHYA